MIKEQAEFTPVTEIEFPDRYFAIWTYYKGHKQLILRSPHFTRVQEPTLPTRVDILFKDVHSIHLPTHLRGLSVLIADSDTAERIAREIGPAPYRDQKVFLVRGSNYRGYVISGVVVMIEDEGEDGAPSALMPYVRTVFAPDEVTPDDLAGG